MNAINYKQVRAYAAQYGTVVGLLWVASFAFYIIALTHPMIGNIGLLLGLSSVLVAGFFVRRFIREITPLRFGQAWWMRTLIFIYASLLMAVGQFIYFRYMDQGRLIEAYTVILQQPSTTVMMQNLMPGTDPKGISRQIIDIFRNISPIQLTFEFLTYNLLLGFLLAVPIAGLGITGSRSTPKSPN
ncbi:MAG: DUF4199 domain-containing protein [Paraprevotella sp.]|nr:DUF4199 domain-containing protein [Paraprevotella sp.]